MWFTYKHDKKQFMWQRVTLMKCLLFLLALVLADKWLLQLTGSVPAQIELYASYGTRYASVNDLAYISNVTQNVWPVEVYQGKQIRVVKTRKWVWYVHWCDKKWVWQNMQILVPFLLLIYSTTFQDPIIFQNLFSFNLCNQLISVVSEKAFTVLYLLPIYTTL